MDIEKILNELKKERQIFHSEDDFKFALSQFIKQIYPAYSIRLERPVKLKMIQKNGKYKTVRAPIDIIVIDDNKNHIPIELKYKTRKTHKEPLSVNEEEYILTNHGASDIGRVGFRKDIYRIEQYLESNEKSNVGFVVVITNEKEYWTKITGKNIVSSPKNSTI